MKNGHQALGQFPTAKPDIFLVISSLGGGGAERVCCLLANHWAEQNRSVWVVVLQAEGIFLPRLSSRVRLIALNVMRARHGFWRLARVLARAPRAPVLIFGFELGVTAAWLKLIRICGNPMIYREGSNPWFQVSGRRRWLYGALISWLDGCVTQGRYVRSQLRRLGVHGPAIKVIYNPLAPSGPGEREDRPVAPVLMAAGRLVPGKGFQRLFEAFAALEPFYPGRRLIIAGEGPERLRLQEQAATLSCGRGIEFCGFVERLHPLYREADLFVLSSQYEGQPNVLLEALLAGCRVLATGGEPVRELLTEIGLPECWLANEDFAGDFAGKVNLVLGLPAERWTMARDRLREYTEIAAVAQSYWSFGQELEWQDEKKGI